MEDTLYKDHSLRANQKTYLQWAPKRQGAQTTWPTVGVKYPLWQEVHSLAPVSPKAVPATNKKNGHV